DREEHDTAQDERAHRPADLEGQRAVDVRRDRVRIAPAVVHHEDVDRARDEDDEESRDAEEEEEQGVGLRRQGRRLLGEELQPGQHVVWCSWGRGAGSRARFASRRSISTTNATSTASVRTPPARTAFSATRL